MTPRKSVAQHFGESKVGQQVEESLRVENGPGVGQFLQERAPFREVERNLRLAGIEPKGLFELILHPANTGEIPAGPEPQDSSPSLRGHRRFGDYFQDRVKLKEFEALLIHGANLATIRSGGMETIRRTDDG